MSKLYTTTHKVRYLLKMEQREFANYFFISYRTVTNWDSRERFPTWLERIFLLYVIPPIQEGTAIDCFTLDDWPEEE